MKYLIWALSTVCCAFALQAVQGGMIAVIAAAMFLLQKFWVFRAAGAT